MIDARKKVAEAKTPREAILVLAACIDALDEVVRTSQSNDGWDTPIDFKEPSSPIAIAEIEALEQRLQDPSLDGDDRRAIEARLQLLRDAGGEIEEQEQGKRPVIEVKDNEIIINLPPASDERQAARRKLAETMKLDEALTLDGATEAFVKGGPLWLYYAARDYVMGLTADTRRAFVNDVLQDSPPEAHEMARDILKDTSPGNHEVTIENLSNAT